MRKNWGKVMESLCNQLVNILTLPTRLGTNCIGTVGKHPLFTSFTQDFYPLLSTNFSVPNPSVIDYLLHIIHTTYKSDNKINLLTY